MRVRQARAVATAWVGEHAERLRGFRGAFFSGSTIELALDAELPRTSDVDVVVLLAGTTTPAKPGKIAHGGVVLEVTYLPLAELADADEVARTYYLAASFRTDQVIADPTGHLQQLQRLISARFDDPDQVRRRWLNAVDRIENGLRVVDQRPSWHEQVTAWMFPASVTTHVVLVAALRNPTVRLRYLNARRVLASHRQSGTYRRLLELLGCADVPAQLVRQHLDQLAVVFDRAAEVSRTPFFFSADITQAGRAIAIDGSRELVDGGDHREAVFWVVATFARCQQIMVADAPGLAGETAAQFATATADLLGVRSLADLTGRSAEVSHFLPELCDTAEAILAGSRPR